MLYAASYSVRKADFLHAEQPLKQTLLRGFLPLLAVMIAISALLLQEPDFGACVVIVAIAFGILFLGGLDWRLLIGLRFLLPVALLVLVRIAPYRVQRFTVFIDPLADLLGKGYQLTHSLTPSAAARLCNSERASKAPPPFLKRTPTFCSRSSPRSSASPVWRW